MITEFILVAILGYVLYLLLKPSLPKNFPPGPTNYPIVGPGPFLGKLSDISTFAFEKLGEIYGPVTGLILGGPAIVINGYEATKEFYTKDEFPHRPKSFLFSYRWGGRQLGMIFSNGRLWQEQRRFTLRHLRDFGFGKTSMQGLIHEEAKECIESIKKAIHNESGDITNNTAVIRVSDKFGVSVINILWAIIAGTRYKHDDEEFKKLLQAIFDSLRAGSPSGNLVSFYPFLRHLPYFKQEFQRLTSGSDAIYEMLEDTIAKHKKSREPGSSTEPRDLIDVYLDALEESKDDPNSTFSVDQLTQLCNDFFTAGSESTSNSIAYVVLHMLRNPECQEKVHEELDRVVGKNRLPAYEDKQNLPYTFAAITESFRMSPVAPISVPHLNVEDAKLQGYNIPKGTMALVNFTTTNMDRKYWEDPEKFRPERFLDETGKFSTSKLDHVLGFGSGKRQCLGEPLARMSNYLIFTAVMQRFKFEIVPGTPKPSIRPINGFTISPQPYSAKVTLRY